MLFGLFILAIIALLIVLLSGWQYHIFYILKQSINRLFNIQDHDFELWKVGDKIVCGHAYMSILSITEHQQKMVCQFYVENGYKYVTHSSNPKIALDLPLSQNIHRNCQKIKNSGYDGKYLYHHKCDWAYAENMCRFITFQRVRNLTLKERARNLKTAVTQTEAETLLLNESKSQQHPTRQFLDNLPTT